jgi:simple sugar transport system permease protein
MSEATPQVNDNAPRTQQFLREVLTGSPLRALLSIIMGFVVGSVFIVFSSSDVQETLGTFFSRPGDFFIEAGATLAAAAGALVKGSLVNVDAASFQLAVRPLTETLRLGTPLIVAGLGIALGFRVGLFNIGGTGQLLFGAAWAAWVSFRLPLPWGLHLLVAVMVGILAAAMWGAIVGLLKARTGAHEVIVTIMMNYVAINLVTWLMRRPEVLQDPASGGIPKTLPPDPTAQFPPILGAGFALHGAFLLAIAATVFYWWLMERSVLGFQFRMVGYNPNAARTAGINVNTIYIVAMAMSAGFVGIAGANQALGRQEGFTPSIDAGIGFDAITVALLGGGSATGVFLAGLLFGAFKAGSPAMQVVGIAPEILQIVQGAIVLFIAAPPLIRAIFRLPEPAKSPTPKKTRKTNSEGGPA